MHPTFALLDGFLWWARLTSAQQLFYGIGIMAGLATIVMAILALVGFDHHDVDISADHGGGTSLFSTKPLTGFFLGFGWAGGIALDLGYSVPAATGVGLVVGTVLMFLFAWMIRAIYSIQTDGTRQIKDAVGGIGTVYVTLPPSRASGGQVMVTVSGRLETLSALSVASKPIASGEKVKVIGVVDTSTVLVEPLG